MLTRAFIVVVVAIMVLWGCVSSVAFVFIVVLKKIVGFATVPAGISILSVVAPSTAPETPSSSTVVLVLCLSGAHQFVAVETPTVAPLSRHWFEAHGSINKYSIDLRNICTE